MDPRCSRWSGSVVEHRGRLDRPSSTDVFTTHDLFQQKREISPPNGWRRTEPVPGCRLHHDGATRRVAALQGAWGGQALRDGRLLEVGGWYDALLT